ncbi:hypothetical protein B0O80DRAFT_527688, partial [Mortierella sp. GBAus27b]
MAPAVSATTVATFQHCWPRKLERTARHQRGSACLLLLHSDTVPSHGSVRAHISHHHPLNLYTRGCSAAACSVVWTPWLH